MEDEARVGAYNLGALWNNDTVVDVAKARHNLGKGFGATAGEGGADDVGGVELVEDVGPGLFDSADGVGKMHYGSGAIEYFTVQAQDGVVHECAAEIEANP